MQLVLKFPDIVLSDGENLPDACTSHTPETGLLTVPLMVNVSPVHWIGASPLAFTVLLNVNAHGPVVSGLPASFTLQVTSALTCADIYRVFFNHPRNLESLSCTVTPSDFETDGDT